jgi:hypothetical protein
MCLRWVTSVNNSSCKVSFLQLNLGLVVAYTLFLLPVSSVAGSSVVASQHHGLAEIAVFSFFWDESRLILHHWGHCAFSPLHMLHQVDSGRMNLCSCNPLKTSILSPLHPFYLAINPWTCTDCPLVCYHLSYFHIDRFKNLPFDHYRPNRSSAQLNALTLLEFCSLLSRMARLAMAQYSPRSAWRILLLWTSTYHLERLSLRHMVSRV